MKLRNLFIVGASSLTLITAFNNCSKQQFETIDEQAKMNLISSSSVMSESASSTSQAPSAAVDASCDPNVDETCSVDDNKPPVTTSTLPAPQPQQPAPQPQQPQAPAPLPVPVERHCTTNNAPEGLRVVEVKNLILSINKSGATICSDSDTNAIKADLKKGYVDISRCLSKSTQTVGEKDSLSFNLTTHIGSHSALLQDEDVAKAVKNGAYSLVSSGGRISLSTIKSLSSSTLNKQSSGGKNSTVSSGFSVFYANNPNKSYGVVNPEECDSKQSPLFVDLRDKYEKTQKFSLIAPWAGVFFDIAGEKAQEKANEKYQISWFKRSSGFAFIALPNAKGEVLGIDQLFGNNTKGPDGEFAANGYAALAKHDDDQDGVITANDQVFSKLRVWLDRDSDGRSSARELLSLEEAGLTAIDLRYDASFAERDVYNNDILYKSVAKTKDGDYKLVFDVWFETDMNKSKEHYKKELQQKLNRK